MVSDIIESVFTTARSDVTILVAVALERSVKACQHAVNTEVKLSLVNEKWVVNIFLDDEGAVLLC